MSRRFLSIIPLVLFGISHLFLGCEEDKSVNTAVVATCNWLGTNGRIELVTTDDLSEAHTVLDGVDNPQKVIVSPDNLTAYVAGTGKTICIVDVKNKTKSDLTVNGFGIFDMALSEDCDRLVVGVKTGSLVLETCKIAIYDTSDMALVAEFQAYDSILSAHKGLKIAIHPEKNVIYAMLRNGLRTIVHLRGFDFEGNPIGKIQSMPTQDLFGNFFDDYDMAVSPNGKLLLAVSKNIYPFAIDETSSALSSLYDGGGLALENPGALIGNTNILFTENNKQIYVNSTGLRIAVLGNYGGGSILLNMEKLMAEDPNPVLYDIIDFMEGFLPMIADVVVQQDTYNQIVDMFLENELVGIPASTVVSNTCYMLIAPVVDLSLVSGNGVYLLLITYYDSVLGTSVVSGVRVLDEYPNGIAVNEDKDRLIISYSQGDAQKIEVIKRNSLAGWTFRTSEEAELAGNPACMNVSTYTETE